MLLFPPFLQSVWGRVGGAVLTSQALVAHLDAFAKTTHIFSAKITELDYLLEQLTF